MVLEAVAIFSAVWFLSEPVQRIFKFGDIQDTSVTPYNELKICQAYMGCIFVSYTGNINFENNPDSGQP